MPPFETEKGIKKAYAVDFKPLNPTLPFINLIIQINNVILSFAINKGTA